MTDAPKFNHSALSFAYLRRGELPSIMPVFCRDAGLSGHEFESARAAQIISHETPERFRDIEYSDEHKPKTMRHVLPAPCPSFAPPSRKLFEEDWFRKKRNPENRLHLAKIMAAKHIRHR